MLIFAGIYYQRERDRRRGQPHNRNSRSNSTPSTEAIPMSQRPSTPGSSARQSPIASKKEKHDLPPSYNAIPNSLSVDDFSPRHSAQGTLRREKPPPPQRTSSNPPGGTIKKRVQIQEISV
nr:unnamed protein product [Callosobruchus analis]